MSSIDIQNLNFNYQPNSTTLSDVNVQFEIGQFSLLVGPSGSGKSTLLKILTGLLPEFGGEIVNGVFSIPNQLKVGLVFQNPNHQFTLDTPRHELEFVLENLRIDPKLMPDKINAALAFCEIESLIDRQLNTLSGGEKQKVALAIVIAMNRDIILLDEPFASIDPQSRAELIAKLVTLRDQHQKTIIIADHDLLGYKQVVDHVYTIHNQTIQTLSREDGLQLLTDFEKQVPAITSTLPIANLDTAFNFDELRIQIQQHALLSQSSLQIPSGKVTLITGENGIGKSTLFLSMAKLMKFSGEIQMNQTNIQKIKAKKYAREVALIFQDSENQFLTVTMREEIELSKQHRKSDYFNDAMITACLTQLNLNELLDQVVYTLSEGQKKKLQILLMLIVEPEVLLLDEPLKGLDIDSIHQIVTILNAYRAEHQQTIVMISHQFSGLNQFVDYHLNFANQKLTYVETVS